MLKTQYIPTLAQLYNKYTSLNIYDDINKTRQFNIVSAGLLNYLPHIPFNKHEDIFRSILFHQRVSFLEQEDEAALKSAVLHNFSPDTIFSLRKAPSIICTFHLGSYRLINLLLAKKGIPFSLVVAKSVVDAQGAFFSSLHRRFSGSESAEGLGLIDAESPAAAIQILRALKNGRSLVVYIDGNTGAGIQTKFNENSCCIPFLHQKIFVRTGIGFLSHAANVPVLPVICYRKNLWQNVLHFSAPVYPNVEMERKQFAQQLGEQLYKFASPFILQYTGQWEAWLYLHKISCVTQPIKSYISGVPSKSSGEVRFNTYQYGLFKTVRSHYLFNKADFMSYRLNESTYNTLWRAQQMPVKEPCFDANLISELYRRCVIFPA